MYVLFMLILLGIVKGLLLREFPTLQFDGKFKRCSFIPCPRPWCTYAHTDLELCEWNKEKKTMSNSKMHSLKHECLVCIRSDSEK